MMRSLIPLAFSAGIALTACAPSPDAIAPAVVPFGIYDSISCTAARQALAGVASELAALEVQQRQASTMDAIGVVLIAVPVSSLTGGDKAGLVADAKARKLALEARVSGC